MIIILEPQKDTYVTNLKTQNNDASLANVGHAATLDLFKLYNENKNAHSWAVFEFSNTVTNLISNGETLTLTDSLGVSKTFEFDTDQDPRSVVGDNIRINIKAANDAEDNSTYAAIIASVINAVDELDISAYNNSNNQLILKQNKPGDQGDTNIVFNMSNTTLLNEYDDGVGNIIKKFARIEYSNILIKFDLENFKKRWNIGNNLEGAFNNLKAELILKDVTTGISKPKDYSLELYSLNKNFDEGIGKDTIHFSDNDTGNFKDISSTQTWEVQNIVSSDDAVALNTASSTGNIDKGDEDIVFNITEYVKDELVKNLLDDKGFLVKFIDEDIYDNKTYFVKRLGSRHLINKQFVPQLRIKIDESAYNIPTNAFNKVRYLDNNEAFYLFNRVGSKLINFNKPNDTDTLNFRIKSKDKKSIILQDQTTLDATNFFGDTLLGVKSSTINLSKFNERISGLITDNKIEVCYEWYWLDQTTTLVPAGNFVIGKRYKINTSTDTSFTSIGAESNDIGTIFTATGAGSGSNDAFELIEKKVADDNVIFYASETSNETKYENLITSIRITENDLFANDGTNSVEVYFVDTKKEFTVVKVPYELPSENIGEVFYQIYDVESGKTLVDYDEDQIIEGDLNASATKMFYDGEKYKFNLFVPKLFKNKRINFKFKYKDPITNVDKFIFNKKYSVRIL